MSKPHPLPCPSTPIPPLSKHRIHSLTSLTSSLTSPSHPPPIPLYKTHLSPIHTNSPIPQITPSPINISLLYLYPITNPSHTLAKNPPTIKLLLKKGTSMLTSTHPHLINQHAENRSYSEEEKRREESISRLHGVSRIKWTMVLMYMRGVFGRGVVVVKGDEMMGGVCKMVELVEMVGLVEVDVIGKGKGKGEWE